METGLSNIYFLYGDRFYYIYPMHEEEREYFLLSKDSFSRTSLSETAAFRFRVGFVFSISAVVIKKGKTLFKGKILRNFIFYVNI